MGRKKTKQYGGQFKFNVVIEALQAEGSEVEVARAFGIHPVTLSRWKKEFVEKGASVFGGSEEVKVYEERIGRLERMLGQKEVELALLRIFFPGANLNERLELVRLIPNGSLLPALAGRCDGPTFLLSPGVSPRPGLPPGSCRHVGEIERPPLEPDPAYTGGGSAAPATGPKISLADRLVLWLLPAVGPWSCHD